ncbi:MAG: hypothetical protein LBN00_06655 [Oscillospiraceae bacterium]|jgi:predicted secreted protein|nr:hypothetical protein [Oscillospiraceae bacterium]
METIFIAVAGTALLAVVIATIVRTSRKSDADPDVTQDGTPKTPEAERAMIRDGLIRAFISMFFTFLLLLLGIVTLISNKELLCLILIALGAIGTAYQIRLAVLGFRRLEAIKRGESDE